VALAWPGDPQEGAALAEPLRTAAPIVLDMVEEMDHAALDRIHLEPQDPLPAREAGLLLRDFPPEALPRLLNLAGPAAGPDYPLLMVEIRHMGAALSRPAATPDTVCARDARFFLSSVGVLPSPPAAEAVEKATRALFTAMTPYGTGHTMINIHGAPGDAEDRARAWTSEAHSRLRRTKSTYDPKNLLRFGHTV
jgi:hypothetical protein